MTKTVQDYFNLEMQYLHHAMQKFSRQPTGHSLNGTMNTPTAQDPYMARLIEGVAYLNARVKQQIDIGIDEVTETLLQHLRPEYLRGQPARLIAHFSSKERLHTRAEFIPQGVTLQPGPNDNTQMECQFMTEHSLSLQPVSLLTTTSFQSETGAVALQLNFSIHEGTPLRDLDLGKLSLFLNGDFETATTWLYHLTNHVDALVLNAGNGVKQRIGGQERLNALYHDNATNDLGVSNGQNKTFELLKDFFLFPLRFLFLELSLCHFKIPSHDFSIEIFFSKAPPYVPVTEDLFLLHCVPAINLYTITTEPIRYRPPQKDYPLILDDKRPDTLGLYKIRQVTGVKKYSAESVRVVDFYSLKQMNPQQPMYLLRKVTERENQMSQHLVVLGTPLSDEVSISCEVEVHNGYAPSQSIQTQALALHDDRLSMQVAATNVTRPSQFFNPNVEPHEAVKILSATQVNFNQLMELDRLKQFLALHDWSKQSESEISALQHLNAFPVNQIVKGVFIKGIQVDLDVADTVFFKDHTLYFWGDMLFRLFHLYLPINTHLKLAITAIPSGKRFFWCSLS